MTTSPARSSTSRPSAPAERDPAVLDDLTEALDTLRWILPLNSRDFAADPLDALLYGILVGWDCEEHLDAAAGACDEDCPDGAFEVVAARFGWSDDQCARVRRYRAAVRSLTRS